MIFYILIKQKCTNATIIRLAANKDNYNKHFSIRNSIKFYYMYFEAQLILIDC